MNGILFHPHRERWGFHKINKIKRMTDNRTPRGADTFAVGMLSRCFGKIFNTYLEQIVDTDRYIFKDEYLDFYDDPDSYEQNHFELKENIITIKPRMFRKKI